MFEKGKSGNPKGRRPKTKVDLEIEYLAKARGPEAIKRLAYWMRSDNPKASVSAANTLLNRGFGMPTQTQDVTISDERMVVNAPTPEESAEEWEQKHRPH